MTATPERGAGAHATEQWRVVDEGWGRRAVEFATLAEPTNVREYVAMHHRLGVGAGDRLLDVACGSGLAVELAGLRGARCAGIDASPRLLAVARDRNPEADLRVGDMNALPWADGSFDVVTSFRGIWGTTPSALAEVYRVLVPGGRVGLTVWGHIKASPGAWAFAPFTLASEAKVQNQAAMVALGRPGAGEALLAETGFTDVERIDVPFVFEFADPEAYARALASTGPAFEAIQAVGEEAFLRVGGGSWGGNGSGRAFLCAPPSLLVGYLAPRSHDRAPRSEAAPPRRPGRAALRRLPLGRPGHARGAAALRRRPAGRRLRDERVAPVGAPPRRAGRPVRSHGGGDRRRLSHLGAAERARDGSGVRAGRLLLLAWPGARSSPTPRVPTLPRRVIRGGTDGLDDAEQALARWARLVATDPNAIDADDVQALRDVGFDDQQIFADHRVRGPPAGVLHRQRRARGTSRTRSSGRRRRSRSVLRSPSAAP